MPTPDRPSTVPVVGTGWRGPGLPAIAGRPAVIVPVVVGEDAPARAGEAVRAGADVVEWRIDLATDAARAVREIPTVRAACGAAPLLVTYRTTAEGGSGAAGPAGYAEMLLAAARAGADLLDVEADHPAAADAVAGIRAGRDGAGPAIVMSHHRFDATPPAREIVERLAAMEAAGADVAKLAAMPTRWSDVLDLLAATAARAEEARVPLVTMSMGTLGAPSRLVGGRFGSAATFASAGDVSAPGQMPVAEVLRALDLLA
ncbi:MAG: type I 3-dehydroquinate dehydratase [Actinomycetaceae bacterium]